MSALVLAIFALLRICTNGSYRILNNTVFPKIQVYDIGSIQIDSCDAVFLSLFDRKLNFADSSLLDYVVNGGNLYIETGNLEYLKSFQKYIDYIDVGRMNLQNRVEFYGDGIFHGVNFEDSLPSIYFVVDSNSIVDRVGVQLPFITANQTVLYGVSTGRGNMVISAIPVLHEEVSSRLIRRVFRFFYPDVVIIDGHNKESILRILKESIDKNSLFIRVLNVNFQGMVRSKLCILDTVVDVVTADSTKLLYAGNFVCGRFVNCKAVVPFSLFFFGGNFFMLNTPVRRGINDGNMRDIVFLSPSHDTIGFVNARDNIGFIPFRITSIEEEDAPLFLKSIISLKIKEKNNNISIAYFKGPLNGGISWANRMDVFTIDGRAVYSAVGDGLLHYDLRSLPDGVYIIKFKISSGKDSVFLFNKFQGE